MAARMKGGQQAGEFGAKMKRLREERKITLRAIADATKISVATFEALERDDIKRLPAGIFARSIVRAYAQAIGIDPETAVSDFLTRFPVETSVLGPPQAVHDFIVSEPPAWRRRAVMAIVIGLPIAALLAWSLLR
jgi:cytoskeletal protein RodZ